MTTERPVRFRTGDIDLAGDLCTPAGATRGCVICHPHPLYGGDRSSSVVVAVARTLASRGVATLRFDFRGAGASGGVHGGGIPEIEDTRAAMALLRAETGIASVVLSGYSFGAMVAMRLAAEASDTERLLAVAAIAPPLAMMDASFARSVRVPLLLVAGDRDAYCPREGLEELAAGCRAEAEILAGADHFFAGRESEVAEAVASWCEQA